LVQDSLLETFKVDPAAANELFKQYGLNLQEFHDELDTVTQAIMGERKLTEDLLGDMLGPDVIENGIISTTLARAFIAGLLYADQHGSR
jgi:hypothetical protein